MWQYQKRLQYPVNIKNPNPALAKVVISQLGGPDGELGASLRYLSQRYTAPCREVQAILNDIGIWGSRCNTVADFEMVFNWLIFVSLWYF